MITISLCLIVKNEEATLERCLSSIKDIVDEIIIVDTGSSDNTKTIAKKFTNQVFDFEWINDFSAARNYAFSLATLDYILWLDADDVLTTENQGRLSKLKQSLAPKVDAVAMDYHLSYDEYGSVTSSLKRNRLVRRDRHFRWIGPVHEYLEVWGNIIHCDVAITHSSVHHDSSRNLNIYEQRLAQGDFFTPRDLYYYANELLDHQQYEKAILTYNNFLDTGQGWVEDNIVACGKLADCYHALNNEEDQLRSAFRSFEYGSPRAEFCCRIGYYFMQNEQPHTAVFWYNLATSLDSDNTNYAIKNLACSTWLPHLQLCVCYDMLGKYELAYQHNEAARAFRPSDHRILQNKAYLEKIIHQKQQLLPSGAPHD